MSLITLITDFGTRDYYVGAMKGVILQIDPRATIVDITHDIEPHNVVHGAFVLRQSLPWFPQRTVHVVVVDPGVGSDRRILAGKYDGQVVLAPDNGLISLVHRELPLEEIYAVQNTQYFRNPVSRTFHGRDILAPVAAYVATGLSLDKLGPAADRVEVLELPAPRRIEPFGLAGNVLYADHFGNLVTNIGRADLSALYRRNREVQVYVGDVCVGPVRHTYSDVAAGQALAVIGSANMLEISVNRGNAKRKLEADFETAVIVR